MPQTQLITILVIDDVPETLTYTARLLATAGYTVLTAATGAEGWRLAQAQQRDLILLNVVLPDGDGRELYRMLIDDPRLQYSFIILISNVKTATDDQAEADKLRQVLINLPGHAIKFTTQGSVTLRQSVCDATAPDRLLLCIDAEDNGVGIALVSQLCVFESVVYLGDQTTPKSIGLGLASTECDITAHKREEESLRRFATVVHDSNDAITIQDFAGNISAWNRGAELMYGYSEAEALVTNIDRLTTPSKVAEQQDFIRRLVAGEAVTSFETQRVTKDGRVLDVWMTVTKLMDEAGTPLGLASTERDITARKQAEEALRMERSLLRMVIDNLPSAIYAVDRQHGQTLVNLAALGTVDLPAGEETTGKTFAELLPTATAERVMAEDEAVMRSGVPLVNKEEEIVDARGENYVKLCSKLPLKNADGQVVGLVGVTHDITELKAAEAARHTSEQKYRMFIERAPHGIFLVDETGRYLEVNPEACAVTGYTTAELLARSIPDIIPNIAAEQEAAGALFRHLLADGVCSGTLRILRKDGSLGWWRLDGTRVDDNRYLGFTTNITDQVALEEQVHQQQRLETVGQLAAGVAHDFNNLLTGISGFTQFAYDDAPEGSALRGQLAEVLMLAKRAADLTHQLLAFSRRQPLQPVILNVNDVIRESVKMLHRLLGEYLHLDVNLAADLDMVKVDPGQFEQVLVNLAVNARDAMPNTGILTIETANVVLDETYAASHHGAQPGAYVMLAVSDNGIGIDAAVIEHIFEPFFTTKDVGKGTGLGLSTVYGIIKQHGGDIWVYSEPGQGTTFKVYLPRILEDVTREVAPVSTPESSGTETILLVEDNDAVLQVTWRHLQSLGYTVFTASRPSEAVTVLQAHGDAIDLLLTDVVMPEKNGRQLYEVAHARFPRLRVLYMSGYTANAIVHDRVFDSDTPFMEKPFTLDTLARKVREALEGGNDVC